MIVLISSGGEEIYKQFVLKVLCYPTGHIIADIPYSIGRVGSPFNLSPQDLTKDSEGAVIVLVDYVKTGDSNTPLKPMFLPLRMVTIVNPRRVAGKLLLDVRLGDCCYYDETVQKEYSNATGTNVPAWSTAIELNVDHPQPKPKDKDKAIDPEDPTSWVSTGKFVLSITRADLSLNTASRTILNERDDWKGVVDMITQRGQFGDKLFYQIWKLNRPAVGRSQWPIMNWLRSKLQNTEPKEVKVVKIGGRSVYQMTAGESAELGLHFYHGRKLEKNDRRLLEISTDDAYVALLGPAAIEVYAGQTSGKIEQLQLIAKKQLSEQFTRITIQETTPASGTNAALAATELYLQIKPRRWHIALILIMFLLGTFLTAMPESSNKWLWKILGTVLMTGAFWIGFAKLPSGK